MREEDLVYEQWASNFLRVLHVPSFGHWVLPKKIFVIEERLEWKWQLLYVSLACVFT
jgi:hypothetical protein